MEKTSRSSAPRLFPKAWSNKPKNRGYGLPTQINAGLAFTGLMLVMMGANCTPIIPPTANSPTALPPTTIPTLPAPTSTSIPPTPTAIPTSTPSIIFKSDEFPLITISVPESISNGTENQIVPFGRGDTPTTQDIPRHILIDLKGYPGPVIRYQGPSIRIFTTTGLELGYPHHVENARKVIEGQAPDSGIYPALPIISGKTQIQLRMLPVNFQGGKGFRYLEYENTPTLETIKDQYMNYIFQGISTDGKYYISVIMPVTLPFLEDTISMLATQVATLTTPVPNELLFLPILQKLQNADDSEFSPSLSVLDDIVRSIKLDIP